MQDLGGFKIESISKQINNKQRLSEQSQTQWFGLTAESATAIPQIEVILNHVLKGCSLRAQVSWIIPA